MERYKHVEPPKGLWETLVHGIIRPPKVTYDESDVGPDFFVNRVGTRIRRFDREILHGTEVMNVSLFLPYNEANPNYTPPTLILYCHCNASNRLECKQYVEYLPINYGIAGFDFLGCGNTKEVYLSLGCRESHQIRSIVYALQPLFKRIIPWGRSMGASSVLMYGEAPIMVVDSPYTSLARVGKDALYS